MLLAINSDAYFGALCLIHKFLQKLWKLILMFSGNTTFTDRTFKLSPRLIASTFELKEREQFLLINPLECFISIKGYAALNRNPPPRYNRASKSRRTLQNKVRLKVLPEQLTLFVNTFVAFKKMHHSIVFYYTVLIIAQKYTLFHIAVMKKLLYALNDLNYSYL